MRFNVAMRVIGWIPLLARLLRNVTIEEGREVGQDVQQSKATMALQTFGVEGQACFRVQFRRLYGEEYSHASTNKRQMQCASACMHEVCGAKKCALLCRVELYRPSYVDQIWLWCLY